MKKFSLLASIIIAVFITPISAQSVDIDCSKEVGECASVGKSSPCRCDLAGPVAVDGPTTLVDGATYTASGGRPAYHFGISSGVIDPEAGVVSEIGQCVESATVTVTDACQQEDSMSVLGNDIDPFDAGYIGNDCFGAVGGVSPYGAELSCGETSGLCITSYDGCCGRESMRIYDSCGNEITYYNSFGTWSTTYSGCADQSETTTSNCFPEYPYTGCTWTYTSSTSRFMVTDWVPLGSNCDKYKVIQTVQCQ